MMKYYLSTTGMDINAACEEIEKNDIENENNDDEVSDFEDDEEEPLPEDLEESDDDDEDETDDIPDDDETKGDKMLRFWKARSRKLRHEMAISAWMCSPVAKIMEDAKENHNGDERDAVRILVLSGGKSV
jgi:hypothetical protein